MKVTSVNVDRSPKLSVEHRLAEVIIHKKCLLLDQPDQEMHDAFIELSKISITKIPQDSIQIDIGGVIGDKHFQPNVIKKDNDGFFEASAYNQVSLMPKERYAEINQLYGRNISAGAFGENIQVEGVHSIESLPQETILQFGKTAQVKITHLRTFCYKFANVIFPTLDSYFHWKKNSSGVITRLGVLGQVVTPGTILPGDSIKIVHLPENRLKLGYIQRPNGMFSRTPCDPPTNT